MGEVVRPKELEGTAISARRFDSGALKLVPEGGEEMTVVCDCGRCHWLVTTREEKAGIVLTLVCHNCRQRLDLPYTGAVP